MSDEASFRSPAAVQLVERPMGRNTVGVVAWLLLLRTPECPQGRQVSSMSAPLNLTCKSSTVAQASDVTSLPAFSHIACLCCKCFSVAELSLAMLESVWSCL